MSAGIHGQILYGDKHDLIEIKNIYLFDGDIFCNIAVQYEGVFDVFIHGTTIFARLYSNVPKDSKDLLNFLKPFLRTYM